jgi:hypothetical protein
MEWCKIWVVAFLGIAIRGYGWRCHPASICCLPLTSPQEGSQSIVSSAAALPGARA